jgi:hypothetical protein
MENAKQIKESKLNKNIPSSTTEQTFVPVSSN